MIENRFSQVFAFSTKNKKVKVWLWRGGGGTMFPVLLLLNASENVKVHSSSSFFYFLNPLSSFYQSPWYTALLPIRIPPIGNGKKFEKGSRGFVLDFGQDADEIV